MRVDDNMRIAFWIELKNIKGVDLENLDEGNPGIGGTEYMFLSLINELVKKREIEVFLFSNNIINIPKSINSVYTKDFVSVTEYYNELNIDILVMRTSISEEIYELISENKVKTILWAHNFLPSYKIKKIIENEKFIKKYICVSKGQLEILKGEMLEEKSDYIYNFLDFKNYNEISDIKKNKNEIVYIGSLVKGKGADVLIKNWHKIKAEIGNAKLHIIGGGNLYDRKIKLGKRNLAEERFENKIFEYIEKKSLEDSIIFHGPMGMEKVEIMAKARIGICNISKSRETFGLTALEFQSMGIPVVASRCIGYKETVGEGKSGILVKNEKETVKYICKILKDEEFLFELSKNGRIFVEENFEKEIILEKWKNIFEEVLMQGEQKDIKQKWGKTSLLLLIKDFLRNIRRLIFWIKSLL